MCRKCTKSEISCKLNQCDWRAAVCISLGSWGHSSSPGHSSLSGSEPHCSEALGIWTQAPEQKNNNSSNKTDWNRPHVHFGKSSNMCVSSLRPRVWGGVTCNNNLCLSKGEQGEPECPKVTMWWRPNNLQILNESNLNAEEWERKQQMETEYTNTR